MTLGQYDIILVVEAPDDATFGKSSAWPPKATFKPKHCGPW
jgi:hypothetical protein